MIDVTAKAQDLIRVLERLAEVLRQENDLLRRMQPQRLQALQQDKSVLALAYESLLEQLKAVPAQLRGLDPAIRVRVVQASEVFQAALTDNARALHAVKEANERLFKAVVRAIEDKRGRHQGYTAGGGSGGSGRAPMRPPMSLALDQRL